MSVVNDFLMRHNLAPECVDMDKLTEGFLAEMKMGLDGKGGSLEMIPTFVSEDCDIQPGQSVIVLDAGGTNFRTCLVTFDEELKPVISDFRKVGMPGVKQEVSAKEFFGILADNVERLIDKSDRIGFCFSYAANITPEHDGIPIIFSKEIKAPEVVGMPVAASLLKELKERGYNVENKKFSVVNDTVATLLATKAGCSDPASGYVGFILGTGTNTAYTEQNSKIVKIGGCKCGKQIINVESGNYDLALGDFDREYFNTTKNAERYHFEKMISGAYLGGFATFVIKKAIEEGIFSEEFAKRFNSIEGGLTTTTMSFYLEKCHNMDYDLVKCVEGNEEDALNLWLVIRSIIERAAKLTAVNLSSAVLKTDAGNNPRYPVIINADGTTFYKTEFLKKYTEIYLHEFLEKKHGRFIKMVRIDDSPVLGAAIAGLSV